MKAAIITQKIYFSESTNGYDSNTTKEKSGNKKSINKILKEDKNKNEKSNDNIINMNNNINTVKVGSLPPNEQKIFL